MKLEIREDFPRKKGNTQTLKDQEVAIAKTNCATTPNKIDFN